jgi:putative exporter of polyketide antibiotics
MAHYFVSNATLATLLVGLVISAIYLRYMWLALERAAETVDVPDDSIPDAFGHNFLAAVAAVVASALTITLYGIAPQFLYLGILLALISPVAVAYTFDRELRG